MQPVEDDCGIAPDRLLFADDKAENIDRRRPPGLAHASVRKLARLGRTPGGRRTADQRGGRAMTDRDHPIEAESPADLAPA